MLLNKETKPNLYIYIYIYTNDRYNERKSNAYGYRSNAKNLKDR